MVGDYRLAIWKKAGEEWKVIGWGSQEAHHWLSRTGLKEQRFPTSRQAAQAVAAALDLHPELQPMGKAECRKTSQGWKLQGGVIAKHREGRWSIIDANNHLLGVEPTLHAAARKAEWLCQLKEIRRKARVARGAG